MTICTGSKSFHKYWRSSVVQPSAEWEKRMKIRMRCITNMNIDKSRMLLTTCHPERALLSVQGIQLKVHRTSQRQRHSEKGKKTLYLSAYTTQDVIHSICSTTKFASYGWGCCIVTKLQPSGEKALLEGTGRKQFDLIIIHRKP